MSAQHTPGPVDLLAEYLTGPEVGHHSVGLAMPPGGVQRHYERAERFFALRRAFGISGYDDATAARAAILKATGALKEGPR